MPTSVTGPTDASFALTINKVIAGSQGLADWIKVLKGLTIMS